MFMKRIVFSLFAAALTLSTAGTFAGADDTAKSAAARSARSDQDQPSERPPLQQPVDPWEAGPPLPRQFAPQQPTGPTLELSTTTWTPIGPSPLAIESPANVNSNVSGRIVAVAAHPTDPNTIYIAAAGGGVWKTTDGGTTWVPLTDTQRTLSMGALAIAKSNPSVIYAGTGEGNNAADSNFGRGILVSTDAGATWTLSTGPANAFDRLATSQISVDPTNPNIAYAAMQDFALNGLCCANTGVYKTIDGGTTWTNTTTTIDSTLPWSAVIVDSTTPATAYAAHGEYNGAASNGAYKSINSGGAWPLLGNAPNGTTTGRFALALAPSNSQVLYATVSNPSSPFGALSKLVRSDNAGMSFSDLTSGTPNYMGGQGWYDTTLIVDPANSAVVYVAGQANTNSILRSANSGVSWTDIHTGGAPNNTSPHADHHGSAFDANGKLLDGNDGGIYRLDTPAPAAWSDLNGNLNTIQFTGIGLHPTNPNIVIGGSQDNGTELYTGNVVWTERDGGDGGYAKFSPTNGNRAYHQIPPGSGGTAFFRRSDDGGNTWVTKTSSISADVSVQNFYASFSVDPTNGDRVLYGTNRVWETTTGGDAWTAISASGANGFNSGGAKVDAVGIAPSDVNTLYAATGGTFATSSKIFVTTNRGTSWTEHDLPAGTARVNDLQVEPGNAMIAYAVVNNFSANGHVFRTTNGGTSWSNISGSGAGALPDLPVWSIQVDDSTTPSRLYIGADDGVYSSPDLGVTWSRYGAGLPNAQAVQIELNKTLHILGVATHGRGAWEIQIPIAPIITLTVNKTADTNDGVCDAADCSLREALAVAGSDGANDTIIFNIPANSAGCVGTDCTITLTSNLFPAADPGRLTTIKGYTGTNSITLSGNNAVRILTIDNGAKISIDGVNFTAGNFTTAAGIYVNSGMLTLTNCALFNNTNPNSPGGAISCAAGGVLNLTNVTISGNSSAGGGAGIINSGTVTATNCTIANNSAGFSVGGIANNGTFIIGNTIIAGNTAAIQNGVDASGTFTSQGHNLLGKSDGATGFTATGDQTGTVAAPLDPQLVALANNGGPTLTRALQMTSPAINAGDDLLAPPSDQRGFGRNGVSDIGAYEFNGTPPFSLTSAVSRKTHGGAGDFDIDLLNANFGPECRSSGGNHTLVFTFTNNVTSGSASVTSGTGSVSGSPSFSGNTMTVSLTGVTDVQKITVTLSNVTDSFAQVLPNTAVSMNMLIGDVNGNKTVNSTDVSQTKLQSGQAVTAANFREDVNINGQINGTDVSQVKLRVGSGVP